ncbi:glycosyltransferase family 39 protein [Candidatus Nitrosotenuis cloacae]|uniref:glycosyltransferase family 39 protein n=1 Tax=Candidatus Nitrosotenuis cloacae TaxID=1603555 RepID=UPI00069BA180|nr:glycosyltransferase family 39 protein [Candidatus Nitrosotenuis cloacae]
MKRDTNPNSVRNTVFSSKISVYLLCGILIIGLFFRLEYFDETIPISLDAVDSFSYAADIHTIGKLPENYDIAKPGWSFVLSGLFSFFNFDDTESYMQLQKIATIIISSVTIFPLYFLIKKFFEKKYSLLGVVLFAVEPRLIQNSILGGTEPLFIFCIVITALLSLNKNTKIVYLSFLAAGLSTYIRPEGLFLFIGISIAYILRHRNEKLIIPKYIVALLLYVLVLTPLMIHQEQVGMYDSIFVKTYKTSNMFFSFNEDPSDTEKDINENLESKNNNPIKLMQTSLEYFVKYLGWVLIPMFILLVPLGFISFFRNLTMDKLTIIIITIIMAIPALYAYSYPLLETKYLYFLFPFFCIFATYSLKLFIEKLHVRKSVFVICFIVIIATSILFSGFKFDNSHERESALIARHVVENTKIINDYYPESQYAVSLDVPKTWSEYKTFFKNMDRVKKEYTRDELHHPRQVTIKDPTNFKTLDSFLQDSTRGKITHLVLDGKKDRPEFLNEVFYDETKYQFLKKVYDSKDDNLEYHVKIFKVDFELFNSLKDSNDV